MSKIEYVPSTPSQIYRSSLRLAHAHQYCASHTRVISGSEIDTLVNQNSHAAPIRSPVRGGTGFSKSRGLRASVTFFPHPHPALSTFLLLPHFSRGPNFVRVVRERSLRRLILGWIFCLVGANHQRKNSFTRLGPPIGPVNLSKHNQVCCELDVWSGRYSL